MSSIVAQTEPIDNYYEIHEQIGRGQYAVVRRCTQKSTGLQFAAKFVRKRRKGQDCRSEVWHEVEVLSAVNTPYQHTKIVTLHEVFETRNELILILELALGGDLHRHCVALDTDEPASSRSEKEVVFLLRQILEGLRHLHNQNYVHLDIKPNNILLMTEILYPEIRIIDFGLARKIKPGEQICLIVGTPEYVAPEILEFEPVGKPSDIWSIGVVAYVMLTGMSPFAGEDKQETCYNVSLCAMDFPDSHFGSISFTAQDFIAKILQRNPADRPTVEECLNHPWLNTEELVQKSPSRRVRRTPNHHTTANNEDSCKSEHHKRRKKLKQTNRENNSLADNMTL
ncbi:serine/threonine-protein kinase 17A isoform X1 [Exaiptasia diaphana]|uniref:non-specific serine/threonine protein kinase n=1 Tax=Exaiptasia diaphana TaxID=2652724 RepID=A0A913Y111_EXADI|nr:serine/threonine-protein kinase 17A isoform X1 [Exaiptasia diaphana]